MNKKNMIVGLLLFGMQAQGASEADLHGAREENSDGTYRLKTSVLDYAKEYNFQFFFNEEEKVAYTDHIDINILISEQLKKLINMFLNFNKTILTECTSGDFQSYNAKAAKYFEEQNTHPCMQDDSVKKFLLDFYQGNKNTIRNLAEREKIITTLKQQVISVDQVLPRFFAQEIFSPKQFDNIFKLNDHIKDLKQKYAFLQQHYAAELDSSDILKKYRDSCQKRLAWLTALSLSFAIMSSENLTLKDKLYIRKVQKLLSQKERAFAKKSSEPTFNVEIFNNDTVRAEQQDEHLHFIIHADELRAFKANFETNKQKISYHQFNGRDYQELLTNYANDQSTEHATALEELPAIKEEEKISFPQELLTNPHKETIDGKNALVRRHLRSSYYWTLGSASILPWIASTGIVRNGLSYLRQTALSSIAQSTKQFAGSSLLQHVPAIVAGYGLIAASPHVYRSAKAGERTEWKAFGRLALLGASTGLSIALSGNLPSITGLKDALLATGCGAALGFGYCGLGKVINTFSNGGCALPQQTSETIKDHLGLEPDATLLSNDDVD